jgi:phosphatidylserine decarboxylase
MREQAFMTLMRLMPKSALSTVVGAATRFPAPASMHHAVIRLFAKRYGVQLDEAEGRVEDYPTLGQFFTRRLKSGVREIDRSAEAIASPVDGAVSQVGIVESGHCVQAKGISFPIEKLLGDSREAAPFEGGAFATLYLAPKDYHRIHSPLDGEITGYCYLPGQFWPVNAASVRTTEALFAINERLVTYLKTSFGRVAVVSVGATCVARIHAAYDAIVTHTGQPARAHRYDRPIPIEKGAEIGMFEMGSTVILLFEKGKVEWESRLTPDLPVRLGERLGRRK